MLYVACFFFAYREVVVSSSGRFVRVQRLLSFVSIKCLLQAESSQKRGSLQKSLENCVFVTVVALFCDVVHLHIDGLCWDRWPSGHICLRVRASTVKYVKKSKHLLCVCVCVCCFVNWLLLSVLFYPACTEHDREYRMVLTQICILFNVVDCR